MRKILNSLGVLLIACFITFSFVGCSEGSTERTLVNKFINACAANNEQYAKYYTSGTQTTFGAGSSAFFTTFKGYLYETNNQRNNNRFETDNWQTNVSGGVITQATLKIYKGEGKSRTYWLTITFKFGKVADQTSAKNPKPQMLVINDLAYVA